MHLETHIKILHRLELKEKLVERGKGSTQMQGRKQISKRM